MRTFLFIFAFIFLYHYAQNQETYKIDSLTQLLAKQTKDTARVNTLNQLFWAYKNVDPDSAMYFANKALKISTDIHYKKGLGRSYNNLGNAFTNLSQFDSAFYYYQKSMEIYLQSNDKKGLADVFNNIGIIHTYIGNYDSAISYYNKSLKIEEDRNNIKGITSTYSNIGVVYYYKGNLYQALAHFLKSLAIEEANEFYQEMSYSYSNICEIYYMLKEYDKALAYNNKSIEIKEKLGDKSGIAFAHYNLGLIYFERQKTDSALFHHLEALKIREVLNDRLGVSYSYDKIGSIFLSKSKTEQAYEYFKKSLDLSTELGDKMGIASSHVGLGKSYFINKKLKKSIVHFTKAHKLSSAIGNLHIVKSSAEGLSQAYKLLNNYKKAYDYHVIFKEINDSIFLDESRERYTQLEMQYEFDKQQKIQELKQEKLELKNRAELKKQKIIRNTFILGFVFTLLLVFLLLRNYHNKNKANKLLAKQKKEIEYQHDQLKLQNELVNNQKQEIIDSIVYASRIQRALFIPKKQMDSALAEYMILNKPRDIVSGDFYWLSEIDNKVVIAVADCPGHGVPGAFMSILGISFLNKIVNEKGYSTSDTILNRLRYNVINALHQTGIEGEASDGMDISLVILDKKTNQIEYSGAMNSLIIVKNTKEIIELKPDIMPIAIHQHINQDFSKQIVQLDPRDAFYLFTDGYIDQFGGTKDKRFTKRRFKRLLLDIQDKPMQQQANILDKTIEEWKNTEEQIDDMLVLGVKLS